MQVLKFGNIGLSSEYLSKCWCWFYSDV